LAALLEWPLPPDLLTERIGVPTPFRRLDLTHFDVLAVGRRFAALYPDRSQAILLLGLRTSGSYFAPLLRVLLKAEGYQTVASITVQPDKGPGSRERGVLRRCARQGFTVLIVDDPPYTAGTILLALEMARRVGFAPDRLRALIPTHPARRNWFKSLPDGLVVSLEPEQWHKHRLLDPEVMESRLAEYFQSQGFVSAHLVASSYAEEQNNHLRDCSHDVRGTRLKRIYEVHLRTPHGQAEVRYVLAKSVGWGWLGYHGFLAGHRLAGFVPPILGLRGGILYMEWVPQPSPGEQGPEERRDRIDTSARYVATRVRRLDLARDPAPGKGLQRHQEGLRLLEKVLSKAYGRFVTGTLMRARLQRRLCEQPCPVPTLIDGNMGRSEWIVGPRGLLKTDYEHHGMGKTELNVTDPAYDLAETILNLALSPAEEESLIRGYVEESGDSGVEQRLFMNKLLAGLWAMDSAQKHLFAKPRAADRQGEFHQRFMGAWNFLTIHAARFCGGYCRGAKAVGWRSPLIALDIDGVLDRRLLGFPCTTAAGVKALSVLSAHGFCVTLNTARSASEVKDYCRAYALAGGVAEQGSYLWDALSERACVLIGPETVRQLEELRSHLRRIPGVFLDDRHQYSIRAFMYDDKGSPRNRGLIPSLLSSVRSFSIGEGAPIPLPTLLMHHLMTDLGLDRLCFHHTTIDTTVLAKDVDKGTGLLALRDWVLGSDAETISVGDSEQDLPMFRAATRCFAPAQISCAREARLLGCEIVRRPFQRGLLDIAHRLAHSDGRRCERCVEGATAALSGEGLFLDVLQAADQRWVANLAGALFDPAAFRFFVR
jgi:hydroxymethylpyrimidine pyrophosphatase-like HAD family hydrolase